MAASILQCTKRKQKAVIKFLARNGEHRRKISQKFVRLGGNFQKWKNKRYSSGIPSKASTKGNLEYIEEFIRVDE
jgi:hypothetical protein